MKSYLKILLVTAITLALTACGGGESNSGDLAGNAPDVQEPNESSNNNPPQISGTPPTDATVGMFYSFGPSASDADGDSLSFTATGLPSWLSLDAASGALYGTPGSSDSGLSGEIVLTVSDGSAQASLAPFAITVGDSGSVVSVRIASGMDDVEEEADNHMYVDSSDLELINDGNDQLVGLRFTLPVPRNAVITQANLRFTADETSTSETDLVIWAQASDDAEPFTATSGNVSARSSTLTTVAWKPQAWSRIGESGEAQTTSDLSPVIQEVVSRSGWNSDNHLVLVVSGKGVRTADSFEGSAANAAMLTVSYTTGDDGSPGNTNQTPTISGIPDSGATVGYAYSFTPVADDPDGDSLTFSIANKPAWAVFDDQSGTLSGTPAATDAGSYGNIGITVSDGESSATLAPFSILVTSDNRAPTISGVPVGNVIEQSNYSFTPTASDPDGDSISFSISNKPSWAVFDTASGNLSGTPGYDAAGTYSNIVISVSDGSVSASLSPFAITVADLNRAPVISGTPSTSVDEGSLYSFTPSVSDADGNTLTYSISNRPGWASFNNDSGTLSGTPDSDSAGSYSNIVISVSDGVTSASLAPFTISVADVNQAPVISGSPSLEVTAGSAYSFTPSASDDDGDTLTYSISNPPAWASFDTDSGTLSGTPDGDSVGSYSNIVISVSDGVESASLAPFSISVADLNQAPVISGNPSLEVAAGSAYSFTPSASDEDGDTLTYSISNAPSWASFDSDTGTLSGTPQETDVGDYADIQISVSDGSDVATLSPFSITVSSSAAARGSIVLNWTAPTTRTDDSALDLSEIGGYVVYLGTSISNLQMVVDLNDSTSTSYTIDDLELGTYYVAVTTYDTDGSSSNYSNVVRTDVTD